MRKINDEGVIIMVMPRELEKARDMLTLSANLMTTYIVNMERLMKEEGINRRDTIRHTEELRANVYAWLEELSK